nr:transient receptor potential cation channel subfamily V member 2-like isoform X3 [Dromaius novaehollandiae]
MDKFTNGQPGPGQRNRLMGLLETDDSIQEDKPASSKKEERIGLRGKKGEPRPLETPYQKESSDYAPKIKINLNFRPGLVSNQKDPNRFDRDRLFSAVSRGSPEALDGLLEYLRRTSKFLTNSEYTDAKTGKTCLMKALLNLKNGRNDTIPVLLEIDRKTENPRPLVNVACSDCYYRGQTALHIAIEKRNLDVVKLLVENGADVHARAHGEFFKKKKEGICFYFGELPLSLAACTNQPEVVEYLLNNPHQKARIQEQDTQGNTVLHALVMIADDTEENTKFVNTTYVEILKAGVKVDPACKLEEIVNYDGLNPLQLAARTGKVEIFKHIVQREIKDPAYRHLSRKFTEWTYGPIHVSLYDLSSIDSFEENSVLEILAYSSDTPNRYKMVVLEPLNKLLQHKWETFASKRFYFSFLSYLSFMIIFTAIACYQPLRVKPSFPVEFTAGGFLWVSGLIIILLGGVYLIFAQLHPGILIAVVSSAVWCKFRKLCSSDGFLSAFGMGEHAVLHSGLPAHWDLQCHDTEDYPERSAAFPLGLYDLPLWLCCCSGYSDGGGSCGLSEQVCCSDGGCWEPCYRAIAILEIEKAWLWRQGGKRRSGCFLSVGLNKKDERWCFRVEEIKWTNWAKEVGVLKEDPGNSSDSEINPEETRSWKRMPQKQLRSAVPEEQSLLQPQLSATEMMPLEGQTRNL